MLGGAKLSNEVFISYSSKDADFANSVCKVLEQNGVRCWISHRNITPGLEWMAKIIEGIDECKVMVLIFSSHANRSTHVHREVEQAISKGLVILPFRIEKVDPTGTLLYALSGTQRLDGFHPPIATRLNELVETVLRLLGTERTSVTNAGSPPPIKSQAPRSTRPLIATLLTAVAMLFGAVWISMNWEGSNPPQGDLASGVASAPRDPTTSKNSEGSRPPHAKGWPAGAPPLAIAPFDAEQAQQHQDAWAKYLGVPVEYTNSLGMKFRLIPPGIFDMGSSKTEIDALLNIPTVDRLPETLLRSETPVHRVELTEPFYLSIHEVTWRHFNEVMGDELVNEMLAKVKVPAVPQPERPVSLGSWMDYMDFCNRASMREKLTPCYRHDGADVSRLKGATGYRLATEAEWEYACRAGTTTKYWSGETESDLRRAGSFDAGGIRPVGLLDPNPFGLFDVHANVAEFVEDHWEPDFYKRHGSQPAVDPVALGTVNWRAPVYRGGSSATNDAVRCRSSSRAMVTSATIPQGNIGMRIVKSISDSMTTQSQ